MRIKMSLNLVFLLFMSMYSASNGIGSASPNESNNQSDINGFSPERNEKNESSSNNAGTSLEEFYISGYKKIDTANLSKLTSLRKLSLGKAKLQNLDFLKSLTKLTHLDISEIQTKDISALSQLKNLVQLKIRASALLDYSVLNEHKNLTEFYLKGSLAGSTDLFKCSFIKQLKKLGIRDYYMPDLSSLSPFVQLESLELSSIGIEDIEILASFKALKYLDLSKNRISNIKALTRLPQLTFLNLDYNRITDHSILSAFSQKTKISLYGQKERFTFILKEDSDLIDWPPCLKEMTSYDVDTSRLPGYFFEVYKDHGVQNIEDIFVPVKNIVPLGHCPVSRYLECPNFPEHHHDAEAETLDSGIGYYYWFDFDIISVDKTLIPLRMVYCYGDGDTNDGMWGAFWDRNTGKKMADIKSTGDSETTIEVSSKEISQKYKNHGIWLPDIIKYYREPDRYRKQPDFKFAHNSEFEKLLGVAFRMCESFSFKTDIRFDQIKKKPTDLEPGRVFFADIQLEKQISKLLNKTGPIKVEDVESITELAIPNQLIYKLTGFEHFKALVQLDLSDNRISDLSALAGLKTLKKLNIMDNMIFDLSPLL